MVSKFQKVGLFPILVYLIILISVSSPQLVLADDDPRRTKIIDVV